MRRCQGDEGLTLVELLVSITIIGVAAAAMVGGMFTYTAASGTHRSQADVQLELRRYAEAIANTAYTNACTPTVRTSYTPTGYTAASGYSATNSITLWNPATTAFDINPAAGCIDPKLQRMRLTVTKTGVSPYSETVDVVKRDGGA